jgi:hypothetical protein
MDETIGQMAAHEPRTTNDKGAHLAAENSVEPRRMHAVKQLSLDTAPDEK